MEREGVDENGFSLEKTRALKWSCVLLPNSGGCPCNG